MQEDQQKQLTDMKENIGYYQKKAQKLEVQQKPFYWQKKKEGNSFEFVVLSAVVQRKNMTIFAALVLNSDEESIFSPLGVLRIWFPGLHGS